MSSDGDMTCGMHMSVILHRTTKSVRGAQSNFFLRDSSIHILTESECLYCFSGLKQVSSNVDIACGMHVSISLHRVTNDSVSRKQTFNRRPSISGQTFKNWIVYQTINITQTKPQLIKDTSKKNVHTLYSKVHVPRYRAILRLSSWWRLELTKAS